MTAVEKITLQVANGPIAAELMKHFLHYSTNTNTILFLKPYWEPISLENVVVEKGAGDQHLIKVSSQEVWIYTEKISRDGKDSFILEGVIRLDESLGVDLPSGEGGTCRNVKFHRAVQSRRRNRPVPSRDVIPISNLRLRVKS